MMLKVATVLLWSTALSILAPGCAGEAARRSFRSVSEKHILFNPDWTGIPPINVIRSPWPSTDAYVAAGAEILDYQVRVMDRQGLTFRGDDQYYRRVDSVRTGRRFR